MRKRSLPSSSPGGGLGHRQSGKNKKEIKREEEEGFAKLFSGGVDWATGRAVRTRKR